MFDGEHHLGGLLAVVGLHEGTAELVLRIGLQRANEDQFGRAVARAVAPGDATTALGLAQTAPVVSGFLNPRDFG